MKENFIEQSIQEIRETVGNKTVLLALSGGVDSAVCAALHDTRAAAANRYIVFFILGKYLCKDSNYFTKLVRGWIVR